MGNEIDECYRMLDLESGASLDQVKQAWRFLVKVWHPDRFLNDPPMQLKAQERLKEINGAYYILEKHLSSTGRSGEKLPSNNQWAREKTQNGESSDFESRVPQGRKPKKMTSGWRHVMSCFLASLLLVGFGAVMSKVLISKRNITKAYAEGDNINPGLDGGAPKRTYKELDEKNGFKGFRFGMSMSDVQSIAGPTREEVYNEVIKIFHYESTPINSIGDYPLDWVKLVFFKDQLCRVLASIESFPNEILEACKLSYGEPVLQAHDWAQKKVKGNLWKGEIVRAGVVATNPGPWDMLFIDNVEIYNMARSYLDHEKEQMAKDFTLSGFKELVFGMNLDDVKYGYDIVSEDKKLSIKSVGFKGGSWQSIGGRPLKAVTGEFFKNRLFCINLFFDEGSGDFFDSISLRFGEPVLDSSSSRGSKQLVVKSCAKDNIKCFIFGEKTDQWDTIQIVDMNLFGEAEKFKNDAPRRAAEDF